MDTRPIDNPQKPRRWSDLVRTAREASPPEGIDVRDSIRQAIRADAARLRSASPPETTGLLDDLAALCLSGWMRGALAALALATGVVAWEGADAAAQFAFALDLQGMLLASL